MTMQKWGGIASFLLPAGFLVAPLIYLVGDLRNPLGPLGYVLADFLYGPLWAASLVTAVFALREHIGERAPRRMALVLIAAALAAGAMVLVACIRAANRQYHLGHPELQLEESIPVLVVWTTIVAGITAAGWHFLGWALLLLGSAAWTTALLPRALSVLYLAGGTAALLVYVFPELEGAAALLGVLWAVWQGAILWQSGITARKLPNAKTTLVI
jgi:hypothetical protein